MQYRNARLPCVHFCSFLSKNLKYKKKYKIHIIEGAQILSAYIKTVFIIKKDFYTRLC